MQLVGTLAAGVVGAENGYAKILVRGSTKRARYFSDFEGQNAIEGSDVLLDEHGGAVVYTNITVDVLVYGKNDQLVRRWVEASTAACVEVISRSFTGADYETGVSGPSRPTTAASVFDRLLDSFGAEDFLVKMPDGSKATLQDAVGGINDVFYSVKSPLYGAVGNGIANDRPAIQAAIDACYLAGGGVVFLPAGKYLLDAVSLTLPMVVSLTGAGAAATLLISPSTVNPVFDLLFSGTVLTGGTQVIQGIGFSHNTPSGKAIMAFQPGRRMTFRNCFFETRSAAAFTFGSSGQRVGFDDCDFSLVGSGSAIDATGASPRDGNRVDVRRCRFIMSGTGTPTHVLRGANIHMFGCLYDGTLATTSNVIVVMPESIGVTYGSVRCCEFVDSPTRPIVCMHVGTITLATEWFTEDGNTCAFLSATTSLYNGTFGTTVGYYARLGTRESRITSQVSAAATITLSGSRDFGIHNIRYTGTTNFVINSDTANLGGRIRVLVVNGDASARTVTFGSAMRGGSFVIGAGKMIGFEFVRAVVNNGTADVASWYLVGTSGILTTGTDSGYPV